MAPARSSLARCVSLGLPRHPFQAVIESLGLDPAATCADRLILRLQPSGDTHRGRRVRYLPPHRDTWGSNVMAQINLWGPVFPLEPGATMVIWPTLFGRPVPNTSADWDFEKLREAPGRYPLLPECRPPRRCAGGSGSHRAWRSAVLFRDSSACQQAQPDRQDAPEHRHPQRRRGRLACGERAGQRRRPRSPDRP